MSVTGSSVSQECRNNLKKKFNLTDGQIDDYEKFFRKFDRDANGYIDQSELRTVMNYLNQNPTQEELQKMIDQADTITKDGKIEFGEFVQLMKNNEKTRSVQEEELRKAFQVFDRDGNGKIDKEELMTSMTNLGETMTEQDVLDMIKAADSDGDGKISYDEFVKMFLNL